MQHFACVADAFGQVGACVGKGFVERVEHELVYLPTVAEADFGFGRVDVDIHGFGRQVEKEDESRGKGVVQYVAVCLFDGMEHDFVADKTMVDEAILFIGFAFGESRLGNRAIEPQRAIAAVNFQRCRLKIIADNGGDTFMQALGRKFEHLFAVAFE